MDEKTTDIFLRISAQLGELNANMSTTLKRLSDHESRLTNLERAGNGSVKSEVVHLLVKGLVASIFVIGSLTGASAIIKQIFNMQ